MKVAAATQSVPEVSTNPAALPQLPPQLLTFCRALPKAELHAHLNGCVRDATIQQLLSEQSSVTLTDDENAALQHKGSRTLQDCFRLFGVIHRITTTHEAVTRITQEVIHDFREDGVLYLELRTTPKDRPDCGMTKASYVDAVLLGIERAVGQQGQAAAAGDERHKGPILVKLLLSIDRREGPEEAMRTVHLAAALKDRGVVGVDLSGNPSIGSWAHWEPALQRAQALGLHTTLHAAEVYNPAETAAVLAFRPGRLGHMCCTDDTLDAALAELKVPVELCLTSNLKTNSVPKYGEHHFKELYRAGHPVVLCTDDSGVFGTTLSEEYAVAAVEFGLGEAELWGLAAAGMEYAFCSDEEKNALRTRVQEVRKQMHEEAS